VLSQPTPRLRVARGGLAIWRLAQRWLWRVSLACFLTGVLLPGTASAQRRTAKGKEADAPQHLTYTNPRVVEMVVGLQVTAGDSEMGGTFATTVFPTNWPEQKVEIVEVNMQPGMSHTFRNLPGNNQQMLIQAPRIFARATVVGTIKVRIEKRDILGPSDPSQFVIPRPTPSEAKQFTGNSPMIDAASSQVRKIARDIAAEEPANAWEHVEKIYDWVRENIAYQRGAIKDTKDTLKDKTGDCEEMSSLFIALCRASNIPARMVWIPNHCYPEFYLEDGQGNGVWFPCQAAGTHSFGSMAESLPILQKGDRFKVPEKRETQRYLADYLTSQKVTGSQPPRVEFIRQLLGDAAGLNNRDPGAEANLPAAPAGPALLNSQDPLNPPGQPPTDGDGAQDPTDA
jgi:hypothetical protein